MGEDLDKTCDVKSCDDGAVKGYILGNLDGTEREIWICARHIPLTAAGAIWSEALKAPQTDSKVINYGGPTGWPEEGEG